MALLTFIDRKRIETLFAMGAGYVMDFTNDQFKIFVWESVEINIYDSKYEFGSSSKANRLRKLWEIEASHVVSKLLSDLAEYWKSFYRQKLNQPETFDNEYDYCIDLAKRIGQTFNQNLEAIKPNNDDESFEKLVRSIKVGLLSDEPETEIDRLHTFLFKYIRVICDKHGILYDNSKPLNSLFGEYIKYLKNQKLIESEMTARILYGTVPILENFNRVRNSKSFAHPNTLLGYHECILIFDYVCGLVKFIDALEIKIEAESEVQKPMVVH